MSCDVSGFPKGSWLAFICACGIAGQGCRSGSHVDTSAPKAAVSWPTDLTQNVVTATVMRCRGEEPCRTSQIRLATPGLWETTSPRRGEADPDAVARLFFALGSPAVSNAQPAPAKETDKPAFRIELGHGDGRVSRVTVHRAVLGQPIHVAIEGRGDFMVSPVEFATKLPDPDDLLPAGLWVSARHKIESLKVDGPVSYAVTNHNNDWSASIAARPGVNLDDLPGVITGRQAVDHPTALPDALGLDKPIARARLCVAGGECRDFRFSSREHEGVTRYFAQGPGADPLELRDDAWRLLVNGPGAAPAIDARASKKQ